jgi:hypothetical protein
MVGRGIETMNKTRRKIEGDYEKEHKEDEEDYHHHDDSDEICI